MVKRFVRKLQRVGGYSYALILPKALVKEFKWKERQKLEIIFGDRKHDVLVRDWNPKGKKKA